MKLRIFVFVFPLLMLSCFRFAMAEGLVPSAALQATVSEISETDQSLLLTVVLDQPAGEDGVEIKLRYGGSALAGVDYVALASTVFIPAGQTQATLNLVPIDDAEEESTETLSVSLGLGAGYVLGETSTLAFALTDDDAPPAVGLQVNNSQATEGDVAGASIGEIQLQLDRAAGPNGVVVTLGYSGTVDLSGESLDFEELPTTITIPFGEVSATVSFAAIADSVAEGLEYLDVVVLSGSGYRVGSPNSGRIEVVDAEYAGVLSFSKATYRVSESTSTAMVSVYRQNGSAGAIAVSYNVLAGSAKLGEDFSGASGTLNWSDGDVNPRTILIPITNDALLEAAETVRLQLSGATGGAALGAQDRATLNILDDDQADKTLRIELTSGSDVIVAIPSSTQLFGVRVVDAAGEAVAEADLTWTLSGTAASAGGALQADNITDNAGEAEATAFFGATPALYTLTITAETNTEVHGFSSSAEVQAEVAVGLITLVDPNSPSGATAEAIDAGCAALAAQQAERELTPTQQDFLAFCGRLLDAASGDDIAEARAVVKAITPRAAAVQSKVGRMINERQTKNIAQRLRAVRAGARGAQLTGLNISVDGQPLPPVIWEALGQAWNGEHNALVSPWGVFVNGNISHAQQDDTDQVAGYDVNGMGLTAGIDRRFGAKGLLGMALGVNTAGVEVADEGGEIDHRGFNVITYGTWYYGPNSYVEASITGGFGALDITRNAETELLEDEDPRLTAETRTRQLAVSLGFGYELGQMGGWSSSVLGQLDAQWIYADGYEEQGDNLLALSVSEQSDMFSDVSLGVQLNRPTSFRWGVINPQFALEYITPLGASSGDVSAAPVALPGYAIEYAEDMENPSSCRASGGVVAIWPGGFSAYGHYAYAACRSGYVQHDFALGGRWELSF